MKILPVFFSIIVLVSCNNSSKQFKPAENALDAGREFIDGCLKGNFDKAKFYLLDNQTNDSVLNSLKKEYNEKESSIKSQLSNASITILSVEEISENETIITYQNSYSKETKKVKVIKMNDVWKIDLTYSVNGNL